MSGSDARAVSRLARGEAACRMTRRTMLGPWMTGALVVGGMIGAGIFMLPANLAPLGPNAPVGWLVSGLGALALAYALARLARRDGQGIQAYIERVLDPAVGFAVTWAYFVACWAANAALALTTASALARIAPVLDDPARIAWAAVALILHLAGSTRWGRARRGGSPSSPSRSRSCRSSPSCSSSAGEAPAPSRSRPGARCRSALAASPRRRRPLRTARLRDGDRSGGQGPRSGAQHPARDRDRRGLRRLALPPRQHRGDADPARRRDRRLGGVMRTRSAAPGANRRRCSPPSRSR